MFLTRAPGQKEQLVGEERPVLDLSGPVLSAALVRLIKSSETLGGIDARFWCIYQGGSSRSCRAARPAVRMVCAACAVSEPL